MVEERGVGKCEQHHQGSYGYPSRPDEAYDFCPKCGKTMVWKCLECGSALPDDSAELETAAFCRDCGAPYFPASGKRKRS